MRKSSILVSLVLISTTGCYSKADGTRLARQAEHHEQRLSSLEQGMEREREAMQEALANAQAKVIELEQVLEQATQVVTRNSADLGTEVRDLRTQIARLEGTIAELRNELTSTQRQVGAQQQAFDARFQQLSQHGGNNTTRLDPNDIPADKDEHFTAAYEQYQQNHHARARALFQEYARRYADDDNADNALYWIGKTYMAQGRPATALNAFRQVITRYSSGDAVDETLFEMGEAFFALHACTDARNAFDTLISNYRRSALAGRARQRLRAIRRDRSSCSS